jgi:sugar lactone lactonase YvrE
MTVDLLERPADTAPADDTPLVDPEALIEEARRRARRRRIGIASIVLGVAATAGPVALLTSNVGRDTSTNNPGRARGATSATISPKKPDALALTRSGVLLIADVGRDQILELQHGEFRVVAGTGTRGFSGDGGQATSAEIGDPGGMAVAPDGSVYFADSANDRIRKISLSGVITTVAGTGRGWWTTTGTPALRARLLSPEDVTFGPDGRLYIAATGSNEVLRLEPNGTLTRIAGRKGRAGVTGIGGVASRASADGPSALAFDARGDLFIAGQNTKTLLMISRDGRMLFPHEPGKAVSKQVKWGFYPRGSGGLVSIDGHVYAINTQEIERLTPTGVVALRQLGQGRVGGVSGFLPAGLAVSRQGRIYTDTGYGNGWSDGSAIVSIAPGGAIQTLWRKR